MQCPSCQFEVSRGTAICPSCDEILDASVFEPKAAEAWPEEKTAALEIESEKPPPRPRVVAKPTARTDPEVPVAAPPPPAKPAPALRGDPRKAKAPAAGAPAAPAQKGRRRRWARPTTSADEVLTDGWAAFRNLPTFEQFSIVALLLAAVSMLFPWRTTDTAGEEIGFFVLPIACLPLCIAGAAATLRMGSDLRGFRPEQLAVIQAVCGLLLVALAAYFFYETLDAGMYRSALGRLKLHTSTPEVGCVACGLAGLGVAASGAWGYLEERGFE